MKRSATVIAAAAVLCAAFAAPAQGWSLKYAKGPDPAVGRWPSWPHPTGCMGVSFDPVAVFSGPTEAEKGSGGPELALRRYLDEGLYPQVPARFWRVVATTDTRVFFASGRLEQGLFWLASELVDGQWRIAGEVAECRARTIRDGNAAVRWDLVPGQHLTSRSKRLKVKLGKGGIGCDGGRSHNAAAEPEIRRVAGKLVLTIWLSPLPPGVYTCEARVEGPLTVELPGSFGKRQLWDGSSYPPRRER